MKWMDEHGCDMTLGASYNYNKIASAQELVTSILVFHQFINLILFLWNVE